MAEVPGTAGYAAEAPDLMQRYERGDTARLHRPVLHLMPQPPAHVLEIGAGTGRDAAWFAARGFTVTAVEPVDALREGAMRLHTVETIRWIDDGLPELKSIAGEHEAYDLVMLTAVLMHLDAPQRLGAMRTIAQLVRPGGVIMLYMRHGPVPEGRTMFDVTAEEIKAISAPLDLTPIFELLDEPDGRSRPGVSWTRLVLQKAAG